MGFGSVGIAVISILGTCCLCIKGLGCFFRASKRGCGLLSGVFSVLFTLSIILLGAWVFYLVLLRTFGIPLPAFLHSHKTQSFSLALYTANTSTTPMLY